MHCIVPRESGDVDLVFDMTQSKYHCILPNREAEGVRQGSVYKFALNCTQSEYVSRDFSTGVLLIVYPVL